MATGYQTVTLGLIGTLAVVTLTKEHVFQDLWGVLSTNSNPSSVDTRHEATLIGVDLGFLVVIGLIAGLSDLAGKITVTLAIGLWLIFLMEGTGSSSMSVSRSVNAVAQAIHA